MFTEPIFTIVVPVFNVEAWVEQCINSILVQTFPHFELLVIDDCSTDNSKQIVEELAKKDSRIKVFYNKKNSGVSFSRNRGIDLARGKYIMFTDSDDWIEPWTLQLLYDTFQRKDITSICYDGYTYLDKEQIVCEGQLIGNKSGYLDFTADNICNGSDYCLKAYTTDSIRNNKIYFPVGLNFEDGEFYFKYFAINPKTYILADQLYYYRRRENSVVTNKNKGIVRLEDIFQVIKNIRQFYIEHGIFEEYKKSLLVLLSLRISNCKNIPNNYKNTLILAKNILDEFGFPAEFQDCKNDMPLVSIIVPIYNVEKYIEQCLDSIQKQSYGNIEIICIDDCGQDNSYRIVKKLARYDNRIRIIKHKENKGLGGARNTGLKAAKGKYVLFIDSDDWIDINCVKKVVDKFKTTNLLSIWFNTNLYYDDTQTFNSFDYTSNLKEGYLELSAENLSEYAVMTWNKAYNKDFLIQNGLNWEEKMLYEDVEFYFKSFTKIKKVYVINEPLYFYRQHRDSIMGAQRDLKKMQCVFHVVTNVYRYLKENNLLDEYKDDFLSYALCNINMVRWNKKLDNELIKYKKEFLEAIDFPNAYI